MVPFVVHSNHVQPQSTFRYLDWTTVTAAGATAFLWPLVLDFPSVALALFIMLERWGAQSRVLGAHGFRPIGNTGSGVA